MQEATTVLWDWLALTGSSQRCDVIFLFGGDTLAIPETGAKLYNQGLGATIVVNGNFGTYGNPLWPVPIAEVFADRLLALGVPEPAIIRQRQSTNTLEDVTLGLAALSELGIDTRSYLLVSRPVHQRRAFATFWMHAPEARVINAPCHEPRPPELIARDLEAVARRCLQEYDRLLEYGAKGDLVPQEIPTKVADAYRWLRSNEVNTAS